MSHSGFDVVVVGGGMAGLTAATRLAEHGKRVVLVEKGAGRYFCNARISSGLFHVCFREIMSGPAELKRAIAATAPDFAELGIADAVAADAPRLIRWMQAAGVRFIKSGPEEWRAWTLSPPPTARRGLDWEGRAGDVMLRTFRSRFEQRGGTFSESTRAVGLEKQNGKTWILSTETETGPTRIESGAVLLADGGFQGNPEMVSRYICGTPERLKQRGTGTGHGDGIRLAEALGARLIGMNRFYGHLLSRDAMERDDLWPYPLIDLVTTSGVAVDSAGRRFADEGLGGVYMTNALAGLDDPLSAFAVFDDAIWNGPGRQFILPVNPHLQLAGATIHAAADLRSLAAIAGIAAERLETTVSEYNAAVDANTTAMLSPERTATRIAAWPIRKPPFYAIPLCAGMTYTMGGIAVDASGRVLDTHGAIIPGLYAAGATTGGLEGGEKAGYVGGLVKSGVGGRRAADAIAGAFPSP